MSNSTVQAHYRHDSPEERAVESWGGIVSARVEDLARELDTTAEELLAAMGRADVDPLVDTARQKGRKETDRPTDPGLRSLALTVGDVRRVEEELEALREATGATG